LHGYFSGWKTELVIAIEKFLAKRTHHLIAIGTEVERELLAAGIGSKSQYSIFFPGLPEPHTDSKDALRKELELDPAAIYCTFVGRLTPIKRPDRLLDVAAAMVAREVPIHFLVAGEGELFESSKVRARAEHLPVTFLGWRKDIDNLFAASDIAILTSDNEGIPLTLILAAQAGLPIIAPAVGSISDIVENDTTGFLTSSQPGAMASALSALATDSVLRNRLGAAGKERAHQYFSLERMLQDHTDIYRRAHKK
jgi:glycosyltransferase involved in cell wall biosynthesis